MNCKWCNKELEGNPKKKFCNTKCKNDYGNNISKQRRKLKKYYCVMCGVELNHFNSKYCDECYEKHLFIVHNERIEKHGDYVVCEICGYKAKSLVGHLNSIHQISAPMYMEQHNKTLDDVILKTVRKSWGEKLKGENNPAYNHGGRFSPFSKKYMHYSELSDEEKTVKITALQKQVVTSLKENQNMPSQIGYWLKQGCTEDEAKQNVSKRQITFSLNKCVERHGDVEGQRVWKNRQDKWQNTLKSKSPEEIERINKAKMGGKGYSKISQKLFWPIYNEIQNKYNDIYFAQLGKDKNIDTVNNNEYCSINNDKSIFFFDFYVKDINKVIEFDGDYWHGVKRGNQKRDKIREKKITDSGISVYRVSERVFKNDPEKTIKECVNWLNSLNNEI